MKKTNNSYEKARAQVKRIKGFYNHLFIYILFLVLWFVFAGKFFGFIGASIGDADDGFFEWANINLWLNPLIWGVIVLVHGAFVFGSRLSLLRNWEERKLQEFMDEESRPTKNQYE